MTIPTTEKLANILSENGAPEDMIKKAREGYYDDFKSNLASPIIQLVNDLTKLGFIGLATRAKNGEFDASKEESDAWLHSPEGQNGLQEIFNRLLTNNKEKQNA